MVITNEYDLLDRLWRRWRGESVLENYSCSATGRLTNRVEGSGTITDMYAYDAYGTLIASTGGTPNNYLFCSEQWDATI